MIEKLKEAGLTNNEAKVYLELLKKGELIANQIAKNLQLDRSLTYSILNNLIKKGQVSYIIKNNKKQFQITNPNNLLNKIKEKEVKINDLILKLKEIQIEKDSDFEIKVYEGKEGLRNLINLMINAKELYSFGSTGWAYKQLYEIPRIAKKISEENIKVKIIGNIKLKNNESFKIKNFQYKFINVESQSPTSIFGKYISIHLTNNENPKIVLIKNKDIAQTYKNYFDYLWKSIN